MRKLQLFFLLGSLIFATGCPKYRPNVDFKNPGSFMAKLNARIADDQAKYNCFRLKQNYTSAGCSGSNPDGLAQAKIIRNDLLEGALPFIDSAYIDFITDLQAGRDRTNFVADLVELGASAAVGITNGERPLQILGVALTAFRGGRRSADLNFYKEQSTPVLITKMDGNRANVRAAILTREKASIEDYPIGAAISDIVDYYNAGTLVRAFTELQKDTALQTRTSEDNLLKLKGVPITTAPSDEERDRSVAAGNALTALEIDVTGDDAAKTAVATKRLQRIVAVLEGNQNAAAALKEASVSSKDDGVTLKDALIEIRAAARLVNNREILKTINQAILDEMAKPAPAVTPTPTPAASPSPTASPSATL